MLSNLLNTLSFGSVIQQNGKPYTVIMRLTDRLFVGMEQNAKLPAPLMLVQVDLKMGPPGGVPGGGQGQGAQGATSGAKAQSESLGPEPRSKTAPDVAPTGSDKSEKKNTVH